jgi:thiamine biosynthesis lipoprotein
LNRSAGAWFQASPELFDVVQQACTLAEETDGLFDPTLLAALEAAGYDKSMDDIRAHGVSAQPRSVSNARSAFRAIQLDEINQALHRPLGTRIDPAVLPKAGSPSGPHCSSLNIPRHVR